MNPALMTLTSGVKPGNITICRGICHSNNMMASYFPKTVWKISRTDYLWIPLSAWNRISWLIQNIFAFSPVPVLLIRVTWISHHLHHKTVQKYAVWWLNHIHPAKPEAWSLRPQRAPECQLNPIDGSAHKYASNSVSITQPDQWPLPITFFCRCLRNGGPNRR